MLHRPTHLTANRSPAPSQGQEPQKEELEEGHRSTTRTGHPSNPTRAPGCRPPTLPHGTPHRTKEAGQPLHQSEATSQSTLYTARPRPPPQSLKTPQPMDQAPKPGTEIQGNPNDPKRAEEPAPPPDNPQEPNLNLNPSPDPDQKACSLSRPLTPDGKQQTAVEKDPKPTSAHSNVVLMRVVVVAWEHSGAKGLAQGPRMAICGIRTRPLVSPPERKPPALTTGPPLPI
ncbi:hypothetical protein AMECASPLE_037126 [Ameca splendens]|uniref:Uncharacterized protein n=1 Tax=Ameca splendens TaxID=208324 RepID=A0ABV0Y8H0_9TELE